MATAATLAVYGSYDAADERAYFDDPSRCGFDPMPRPGTAAAEILDSDAGASLRFEPVAFLESGLDVLATRAGPWFEVPVPSPWPLPWH